MKQLRSVPNNLGLIKSAANAASPRTRMHASRLGMGDSQGIVLACCLVLKEPALAANLVSRLIFKHLQALHKKVAAQDAVFTDPAKMAAPAAKVFHKHTFSR